MARKHKRHLQDVTLPGQDYENEVFQADLVSQDAEPDKIIHDDEIRHQVFAAIEALPESRRIAVKLRLQGYSVKEMSEVTGWPFYKAENLSKRGMAALKDQLKKLNIDYELD